MPTVPGAIGAFRREALADVGAVSADTLAEDTDLTIALGRAGWDVVYAEEARAWTEAPATPVGPLAPALPLVLRDDAGRLEAPGGDLAPRRGPHRPPRQSLPGAIPDPAARCSRRLVDLFALYGIVFLDPRAGDRLLARLQRRAAGTAWYAFRLDGESPRPLWAMPLQQFVYRQLMYLVVIESIISALRGTRLRWQHVERTGDVEVAP